MDLSDMFKKLTLLEDYISLKFGLDFEDFCQRRAKNEDRNIPTGRKMKVKSKRTAVNAYNSQPSGNSFENIADDGTENERCNFIQNHPCFSEPSSVPTGIHQMNLNHIKTDNDDDDSSDQEEFELPLTSFYPQEDSIETEQPDVYQSYDNSSAAAEYISEGGPVFSEGPVGTLGHSLGRKRKIPTLSSGTSRVKKFKKIPLILNGEYFQPIHRNGDKVTAECKNCIPAKQINGSIISTSNFITHLKRVHPTVLNEYQKRLQEEKDAGKFQSGKSENG